MEMEIIKTTRGGDMLIYDDETFTIKKKNPGKNIRWICSKAAKGCKGFVTTDDPIGNPRNHTPHNHTSSPVDVEIAMFRSELRSTAEANNKTPTGELLQRCMQNLSPQALAKIKNTETIRRDIQRHKSKNKPREPRLPTMLDSVVAAGAAYPKLNLPSSGSMKIKSDLTNNNDEYINNTSDPVATMKSDHMVLKFDPVNNDNEYRETEDEYREWSCGYCSQQFPWQQQTDHMTSCELVPVPCPKGCGEVGILRNAVEEHLKVCPRTLLRCDFHCYGCLFVGSKEDRRKHEGESCPVHLSMATQRVKSLEKQLQEQNDSFRSLLDEQNNNFRSMLEQQTNYFNARLEMLEARGNIMETSKENDDEPMIDEQTEQESDLLANIVGES